MLAKGSNLVNEKKFVYYRSIFSRVILLPPTWAEAWNKRATILYMMGRYQESQNDIDQVLKLEKRHFGALAGQGLVSIALENYEKAINSYKEVEKIYPNLKSPKIMIPQIKELIRKKVFIMKKIIFYLSLIFFIISLFASDEKPGRFFEDQPDVTDDYEIHFIYFLDKESKDKERDLNGWVEKEVQKIVIYFLK